MRTLDNYQLERRIGLWDDYLFSRLNFCDLSRPPVLVTEKVTHRSAESRETQPILCFHLLRGLRHSPLHVGSAPPVERHHGPRMAR